MDTNAIIPSKPMEPLDQTTDPTTAFLLDLRRRLAGVGKVDLPDDKLGLDVARFGVRQQRPGRATYVYLLDGKVLCPAFEHHTKPPKLSTRSDSLETVAAMVSVATVSKWEAVEATGTQAFRCQVWLEATAAGIRVDGYEPTAGDKKALEARQAAVDARQPPEPAPPNHAVLAPPVAPLSVANDNGYGQRAAAAGRAKVMAMHQATADAAAVRHRMPRQQRQADPER